MWSIVDGYTAIKVGSATWFDQGTPWATLTKMAGLSGLFIGALSTQEEQVITWSLIAMFLFAALGGA